MDESVARNGAIYLQNTTIDVGVTGIGIRSSNHKRSRPNFSQRTAGAAILATVPDHAGKGSAQIFLPTVTLLAPKKTFPSPSIEPTANARSPL
jgi:hypothetical protein